MARRPNQNFVSQVEQEITYRAIPTTYSRGMLEIVKVVDGVDEQEEYPYIGSEETLTMSGFGINATFTVFVLQGFDDESYRPFRIGIIGADGFEVFAPKNMSASFHIGATEVFYDWVDGSWSRKDSDHGYDDFYYDDGNADLYDYAD